jgi:hypothetical protein
MIKPSTGFLFITFTVTSMARQMIPHTVPHGETLLVLLPDAPFEHMGGYTHSP